MSEGINKIYVITVIYHFNDETQPMIMNSPLIPEFLKSKSDLVNLITGPIPILKKAKLKECRFRILSESLTPPSWYQGLNEKLFFLNGVNV